MAESFLVQIDLEEVQDPAREGTHFNVLSYVGGAQLVVTPTNFSRAKAFLKSSFRYLSICCDAVALDFRIVDIISLLNNGASKVFVSESQFSKIVEDKDLADLSRLIITLGYIEVSTEPTGTANEVKNGIQILGIPADCGVAVNEVSSLEAFEKSATGPGVRRTCYVKLAENSLECYKQTIAKGHVPIIPASWLTVDPEKHSQKIPAWSLVTSAIHSDRADGLFPTAVTDERGVCLGLVYSNHESIETALKTGSGVYWSRSRNKLWVKGAESGDTQELISIRWDCDADALQFVVRQKGDGMKNQITNHKIHNNLIPPRILPPEALDLFWPLLWACTT